jgi:hypothetical protein
VTSEPKMEKFRKVRAGWWTVPINSFDDVMADIRNRVPHDQRRSEKYIDVSKYGDEWIVSTREHEPQTDRSVSMLNQRSLFNYRELSFSDAKRKAMVLKAYLAGGPHPDYLDQILSEERRIAFETKMEGITGKPYAEWEAEMLGRTK